MKKIRKPKLKSLPKKPKGSNLESWKRWEAKVKDIQKENQKKESDYKKAVNAAESAKKTVESIKRKASGLGKLPGRK